MMFCRDRSWFSRAALLTTVAFALLTLNAASAQEWVVEKDQWFIMELAGGKAGWVNSVQEKGEPGYRTTNRIHMKIERGPTAVEIEMKSIFLETAESKPISMEFEQKMSTQVMHSIWRFEPEHIVHISKQGGRELTKELPLPEGEWLTPVAVDRFAKSKREAGAEEFSYRTLDAQAGVSPIKITVTKAGQEQFELDGKTIPVTVWHAISDLMPIKATEKFDSDGELVIQEVPMAGLGKMVMRRSTRELAQAEGGAQIPELLFASFVKPDKPISDSMKAVRAKLRLKVKEGQMPELPSAGAQRVEKGPDGTSAVLTIDINDNVAADSEDSANKEYIDPSALVDSSDEMVQKLANRAARRGQEGESDDKGPMFRAEALRRLVHKHISKKGMQTAFASASETARTKTGDCSEHGVLLCALLRADGIPARVATGLVYVDEFAGADGIFGWHMWTQALIDGKWVDLDATLPVRYTAGHVLTTTSSLSENVGTVDLASVMQLLGNLEIEVLEVSHE